MKLGLVTFCCDTSGAWPVGVLALASYCRARLPGLEVRIIEPAFEDALAVIQSGQFDVIGLSAMTTEYYQAIVLAQRIRKDVQVIVIGGNHISKLPQSMHPAFDLGVIGDGEEALIDILLGVPARELPGVVYRHGDERIVTGPRRPPSLENYPPLNYDLLSDRYFKPSALLSFADFGTMVPLMTSRGCPFHCIFCNGLTRGVRYHDPDWVLNELETLERRGATHVEIYDDLFAMRGKRLEQIVAGFVARKLKLTLQCNAQAHILDEGTIRLLKQMNVKRIFFGFESGNPRVLKMLKCGKVTVQDNMRAIDLCLRHGIRPAGNVILGSPTETLQEMRDTLEFVRWAYRRGADRLSCSPMTPYPGTVMWDIAKERGTVSDDMDFSLLTQEISGCRLAGWVVDESISHDEFQAVMVETLRVTHLFKWRKLFNFLKASPSKTLARTLRGSWSEIRRMFVRESV